MKISELTYNYLLSVGLPRAAMHTDGSDEMHVLYCEERLEMAKQALMSRYGDVTIIINPDAHWFDQIKIDDEKWREDHERYCEKKAEWCRKYGCD